jgi:hypothetical protein
MKRAIVLAILALTLTFGPGTAYAYPQDPVRVQAFPNSPCARTAFQSTTRGLSQAQLFLLLLPVLVNTVA